MYLYDYMYVCMYFLSNVQIASVTVQLKRSTTTIFSVNSLLNKRKLLQELEILLYKQSTIPSLRYVKVILLKLNYEESIKVKDKLEKSVKTRRNERCP